MNDIRPATVLRGFAVRARRDLEIPALLLTAILGMALAGPAAATERKESIIHEFAEATGDYPLTGPVMDAATGALYGSTSQGGRHGSGVIYQLLPPDATHKNWQYSVIYNYGAGISHGPANNSPTFDPQNITVASGVVYATTTNGGKDCATDDGCGAVLMLTPASPGHLWTATTLYKFAGGSDGLGPVGTVAVDAAGAVYGATSAGGAGCKPEKGCGTVFKLAPPAEGHGWALSTIAVFPVGYDNGYFPYGGVIFDKQGNLYGISWIFDGTYTVNSLMYKLIPNTDGTWTAREMAGFRNGDCQASANLALDQNGMLYGAVPSCQYVFQISPDAQLGNLLGAPRIYSFANGTGTPNSPVTIDASGVVYGATTSGAVYSLTEPASPNSRWTYKLLYQFTEATLGLYPNGGLVFDSAGALYGTTNDGGSGHGVLFRLSR